MRTVSRIFATGEAGTATAGQIKEQTKRQQGQRDNDFQKIFEKACKQLNQQEKKKGGREDGR